MKYLFKKMRRDLINMWTQFFSVFMMALLGILIFASMEGAYAGLNFELNKVYDEQNLGNAWLYGNNIDENNIDNIKKLDDVNDVSKSMTAVVNSDDTDIKIIATDNDEISKPVIKEGRDFNTYDNGIWLDKSYAEERGIEVGDKINISAGINKKDLEVLGLIIHPEYIYYTGSSANFTPDHNDHGYGMINEECAKNLFGMISYNEIRIKTEDNFDTDELKSELKSELGDKYYGYLDRDTLIGVSSPVEKVSQIKKMSFLFSGVFIFLAMLTMETTMTRLISNQRIQIGTLTANGFSKSSILLHYSLYALVVSLIGVIAGIIIGPNVLSPILLKTLSSMYTLPDISVKITGMSLTIAAIVVIACTLATVLSCRKDLKLMPSETLRGEAPKGKGKIFMERAGFLWKKLSNDSKCSLREISRNKTRSIMGIISVFGCMTLIIAGLGMQYTLKTSNDYVYKTQFKYGSKAILQESATDKDKQEIEDISEDSNIQWIMEKTAEISSNNETKNSNIIVMDNNDFINIEDINGNKIELPDDGACITRKMAEKLGVQVGDYVDFKISGQEEASIEIKEISKAPSPQGLFISKKAYENAGEEFISTSALFESSEIQETIKELPYIQEYTTINNQYDSLNEATESISIIFVIMIAAAIVLAVVILYNLGILSYTEKIREYATLKVLGFYQKEISLISLRENVIITVIGWIAGIPIGLCFLKVYVSTVAQDSFEWVPQLSAARFLIASAITVGCAIGVSLFLTFKVKKINMVEALKSVE